MHTLRLALLALTASFFLTACSTTPPDRVYQVSKINALLAGNYDGAVTCADLLKQGNLGIGTFHELDGEMVVVDGQIYQVLHNGVVKVAPPTLTTPYATVVPFDADRIVALDTVSSLQELETWLDEKYVEEGTIYAIHIQGTFSSVTTRSVPAQTKPYRPLVDVVKDQALFQMKDVSGDIVGFRCPPDDQGVNVPGWHLHFVNTARTQGGHVLKLSIAEAVAKLDSFNDQTVLMPAGLSMSASEISKDRSSELNQVERIR